MKILFVCGAGLVGGKERQTLEYMIALRDLGHEIFCATSSWSTGEFEKLLRANNIQSSSLRIGFISKQGGWRAMRMTLHQFLYVPSLLWNYKKLERRFKPSVVVHSNFQHIFLLMPVLGSTADVFHVHDAFGSGKFYQRLFRIYNSKIRMFICVSNHVCDKIKELGVPPSKVELVYNGIRPPENVQRQVNQVPVIGIVGQIGEWKGHEVLLKALSLMQDIDWQLNIIGFGNEGYIDRLRALVKEYGLGHRVVFKGKIEGLQNIYRGIDIACVPSTFNEPFGLAAAEPGFFNIPAVVSNIGGLPEIIVHGKTGLVVKVGDPQSLSAGLRELIMDPHKRLLLGEAAREYVTRLFSADHNILKMESLLKQAKRD